MFFCCRGMKGQEEILEYHAAKQHKTFLGCENLNFIHFNVDGISRDLTGDSYTLFGIINKEIF